MDLFSETTAEFGRPERSTVDGCSTAMDTYQAIALLEQYFYHKTVFY